MATTAEVAYETAKQDVGQQAATLDSLRTRAGVLLTANSITATFLGARVLTKHHAFRRVAPWFGIGFFVLAGVLIALVLLPLYRWEFGMTSDEVVTIARLRPDEDLTTDAYMGLAHEYSAYAERNAPKLNALMWVLIAAALSILAATISWLIALSAH